MFDPCQKVICSHLSTAGFPTSKLLVKYRSNLWACPGRITQPNFQPSATSAICADHSGEFLLQHSTENSAQSQTGVFRYDSPIQNWIRQPAENSVRWIVPIDIMSNVGEMISPRLYCGVFPIWWGKTKSFRFSLPPLSIKLNLACLPDIMTVGSRTIPAKRVLAPRIAAKK